MNAGLLEFVLKQPSIRDSFRHVSRIQDCDALVDKALQSLMHDSNRNDLASKEVLVRFIAHVCFCKVEVLSSDVLAKVIKAVRWMILKPQKSNEAEK